MGLRRLDKVVIAAITGVTAGIGLGLIAATDLAVMADNTYVTLAFSKIGLIPDGGVTWELLRALGYKRAYRLMIEAGKLSAAECLEFGIVNEICTQNTVLERALQWAQQIADHSPTANILTKRALHQAAELTLAGAIAYETILQETAVQSADCAGRVRAFIENHAQHS
jgi:2-(1,2-epoxy-1,2-dihydrophenyl)acetyl-CoA isomerase